MLLPCDKREVREVESLSDILPYAKRINRCVWAQVAGRDTHLYKVHPDGRLVSYTIQVPWAKGRPVSIPASTT
jgi:hypothetical protein